MARTPPLYQKLVGWRGSIGSRFSLWLGADHVLLVEANMMTERYQRVWLRDIQGFLVRPSTGARWACGGVGGLLLIWIVLALALSSQGEIAVMFWVFAALTAPFFIYGLVSARTRHFFAVTAVQRTQWPNVARARHVRKVLARLEPLIREAQAGEAARASAQEPAAATAAPAEAAAPAAEPPAS